MQPEIVPYINGRGNNLVPPTTLQEPVKINPSLTIGAIIGIVVAVLFFASIACCFCCCVAAFSSRQTTRARTRRAENTHIGVRGQRQRPRVHRGGGDLEVGNHELERVPLPERPPPPPYSADVENGTRKIEQVEEVGQGLQVRLGRESWMPSRPPPAYR
ncbi:hypothetical protein SUNI508_12644 [Seiridium unicorne]|uniref:Uncharacterized protein n=1 Tax=Seiridium unicorne TaxID=138068 RepID=A0ABR2VGG9_9PEZI